MICPNCRFVNPPNSSHCHSCGTELSGKVNSQSAPPNASEQQASSHATIKHTPTPSASSNSTVPLSSVNRPEANLSYVKCPNCEMILDGLPTEFNPCINCGHPKGGAKNKTVAVSDFNFDEGKPGESTVMIRNQEVSVKLINERTKQEVYLNGENIQISRSNLDPKNNSISSRGHVEIKKENGKVYLSDISSNNSTYIQVLGQAEVTSGMKVVIGNSIYQIIVD